MADHLSVGFWVYILEMLVLFFAVILSFIGLIIGWLALPELWRYHRKNNTSIMLAYTAMGLLFILMIVFFGLSVYIFQEYPWRALF
jgi:hypothetical protein